MPNREPWNSDITKATLTAPDDKTSFDSERIPDAALELVSDLDYPDAPTFDTLVEGIKCVARAARRQIANEANRMVLASYWITGRMIVVYEQNGTDRASYGKRTLKLLSKRLTVEIGRGYSVTNLQYMRRFFILYRKQQLPTVKLTWTHYCELIGIEDEEKRSFYAHEAVNACWTVKELRRQIDGMLFERVLKAKDDAQRVHVVQLANEGIVPREPADILKEPYLLDFIDLPVEEPPLESSLEDALVDQIESFMLELGRGFMFVGAQQRITIGNVNYHVDMVFYNKLLRSYVLIELKTVPLTPAAVGQVNAYLNYYAEEVNDEYDNPPIGIILCTDKRNIDAHYTLGGLANQVFAQTYTTVLPNKELLEDQVRRTIEANERKLLEGGRADGR